MQCVIQVFIDPITFLLTFGNGSYTTCMITRRFICQEHESFGTKGLVLVGSTDFEPFEGMGCAHDMLEHFPNDKGGIHEEWMALGASIFVRSEGDYFINRHHTMESNLTGDITSIVYHSQEHSKGLLPCPFRPRNTFDQFDVEKFRAAAYDTIASEFPENDYEIIATPEAVKFFVENSILWLMVGYQKAKRRYKGHDSYSLCQVFKLVERSIDAELANMEIGDELTVSVDTRRFDVKTTVHSQYEMAE